jgi:selenocysteine-specific elongation factor
MKSALADELPTPGAEVFGADVIPIRYHYPQMKSVIVGTAGHIDHGKTALVKALTGIDADRLEEEKRRGITIDLGFAHRDLPGPNGEILRLGFVDVPGHERFVRNMLAGVGGIDLVLLVIAADEGVKPQTREHLDICQLLAVRRGIVVLTKSDTVDRETLAVVRAEVEEFLRGSFLAGRKSRIIPVSAMTGAGLDTLTQALADAAASIEPKDAKTLARLPIDRVFTMKGFGTVVTGTLVSGSIRKDDELEGFPTGKRVRVRGVQVHGEVANEALAGQRTALNLAGVGIEELQRGMTLAPHSTFKSTWRADVTLSLLPSAKPLKDRSRVHLHSYTSETVAEVVLYGQKQIVPGQTSLAQLRLAETTLLLPGDRFIIRQFSPVVTIGGGVVLDAAPLTTKMPTEDKIIFLEKMDKGSPEEILLARIARRGTVGLAIEEAVGETGWTLERVQALAASLLTKSAVVRTNGHFLSAAAFSSVLSEAVNAVKAFHTYNPLVAGIGREALRERLDLTPQVFAVILQALVRGGQLEISGDQVRAAGRAVVLRDEEAESKQMIESAFASAGLKVPALKEVLAGLKVDRARAQKIVTLLLRDKVLIKLADDLVFHSSALADLRQRLLAYKAKSPRIDVAAFKELTGVSRKYAIPLLEYLDREHVTRRVGDARVIL